MDVCDPIPDLPGYPDIDMTSLDYLANNRSILLFASVKMTKKIIFMLRSVAKRCNGGNSGLYCICLVFETGLRQEMVP